MPDLMDCNPSIDKYLDIIDLPHPEPTTFSRMPHEARAAEFSSFEALDGLREHLEQARQRHLRQTCSDLTDSEPGKAHP